MSSFSLTNSFHLNFWLMEYTNRIRSWSTGTFTHYEAVYQWELHECQHLDIWHLDGGQKLHVLKWHWIHGRPAISQITRIPLESSEMPTLHSKHSITQINCFHTEGYSNLLGICSLFTYDSNPFLMESNLFPTSVSLCPRESNVLLKVVSRALMSQIWFTHNDDGFKWSPETWEGND